MPDTLLKIRVETEAWATPRPGLSLSALCAKLAQSGLPVLEVDERNNRVRVLYDKGE